MSGGILDFFRKYGGSPFGWLLHGLQWLIEKAVPGDRGRTIAGVIVAVIAVCTTILVNYALWTRR